MIFSELQLRVLDLPTRRRANSLRDSQYAQHQALWTLFDQPAGAVAPFLFREQIDAKVPTFWTLSDSAPHDHEHAWSIRSRPFAPQFASGDLLQFELRANPTITQRSDAQRAATARNERRGKRAGLIGALLQTIEPEQRREQRVALLQQRLPQWLAERGARHGFELVPETDEGFPCLVGHHQRWRFKGKHDRVVTLGVADFSGVLRVADATAFAACVRQGLGHGKRFGLGMWMLRRARGQDREY
jgi:CRISPR system Cascade subunit CasE